MPKVELAVGARLPGYPLRPAGYVMDVDDEIYHKFNASGFFVDPSAAPVESEPKIVEKAEPETVEPKRVEKPTVNRPKNTASLKAWQEYAKAKGIDVKGLSKQEIIAATR